VLLAAVSLVGCIHAPPGDELPFQAQASGTTTIDFSGTFEGTAEGNWLGDGTINGSYTANRIVNNCPDAVATFTQSVTLTAAGGDEVHETVSGTFCSDFSTSRYRGTGSYTITGGTGGFSAATGSGTVTFVANFASLTFTFDQRGHICCFGKDDSEV
jgi:hypothetical protein